MGKDTRISWAHDTFSPWWGCVEVPGSGACGKCYAREFSKRLGFDLWGKDKPRKMQSEHYWNEPIRWNRLAQKTGERRRVFCGSMCDVFEDHPDLVVPRARLWDVIAATPNLDWLLLTKRPENMIQMTPESWRSGWPSNVWAGTTVETQSWLEHRMLHLADVPSRVLWLSVEPMLGPVHLGPWAKHVSWSIVGGESGHGARLMRPEWVRDLLAECRSAGIAFHFKQKGEALSRLLGCRDKAGKDPAEWPEEFRVQEFPVLA